MTTTPEYLDPDKWAVILGLIPATDSYPQIRDETEREIVFRQKLHDNTKRHQDSGAAALRLQKVLWATFTAKYLPSLVDRILDLPPRSVPLAVDYPLRNVYHTTLKFTDPAYLAKFMTSTRKVAAGGKCLVGVIVERLVEFGPIWLKRDHPRPIPYEIYEACIHKAVTTLVMLVIAAKGQAIPEAAKTELVRWLDIWAAYDSWSYMAPDDNVPLACSTLSNLLKYGDDRLKSLIKQRRHALKSIDVCALPTCTTETNLKRCNRCKTVTYCSKDHQIAHWKHTVHPHKDCCHETEY